MQEGFFPPIKRYTTAVERRLRMDRATRVRIMNDLCSDIQNRREAGQTDEQIMAELGGPAELAAELNAGFIGEGGCPKSPWRWLFLAAAVLLAAASLLAGELLEWVAGSFASLGQQEAIGVIGGADGPTAVFVTEGGAGLAGCLPYILALFSGFLLLGWCRGGKKRLALPIALCILPLAGWAAMLIILLASWGAVQPEQRGWLLQKCLWGPFLAQGIWLCLVMLVACLAKLRKK